MNAYLSETPEPDMRLEIHTFNATLQDLDLNHGGLYGKYKTKD